MSDMCTHCKELDARWQSTMTLIKSAAEFLGLDRETHPREVIEYATNQAKKTGGMEKAILSALTHLEPHYNNNHGPSQRALEILKDAFRPERNPKTNPEADDG